VPDDDSKGDRANKREEPLIAWSTHPFVERPITSVGVVLLMGMILYTFYLWLNSFYWVIFCGIVLFLSLSAYFIPTRYQLFDEHMLIKRFLTSQEKQYREFKRVELDRNGLFISPFEKPNRLDNFRGIFLRVPKDIEPVVMFLRDRIPPPQERPKADV